MVNALLILNVTNVEQGNRGPARETEVAEVSTGHPPPNAGLDACAVSPSLRRQVVVPEVGELDGWITKLASGPSSLLSSIASRGLDVTYRR